MYSHAPLHKENNKKAPHSSPLQDGWSALDKFEREAAVPRFYGSILRDLPNGRDLGGEMGATWRFGKWTSDQECWEKGLEDVG